MLLSLMIPLSLIAFTIAIVPVLAMTVSEHRSSGRPTVLPAWITSRQQASVGGSAGTTGSGGQVRRRIRSDPQAPSSVNSPESSAARQMS